MSSEIALKTCPHCGGNARIYVRMGGAPEEFFAGCENLKCPTYTPYAKSEIEAATMWNEGVFARQQRPTRRSTSWKRWQVEHCGCAYGKDCVLENGVIIVNEQSWKRA